jgi:hypothetical protein
MGKRERGGWMGRGVGGWGERASRGEQRACFSRDAASAPPPRPAADAESRCNPGSSDARRRRHCAACSAVRGTCTSRSSRSGRLSYTPAPPPVEGDLDPDCRRRGPSVKHPPFLYLD